MPVICGCPNQLGYVVEPDGGAYRVLCRICGRSVWCLPRKQEPATVPAVKGNKPGPREWGQVDVMAVIARLRADGLKQQAIARELGISQSAVSQRLKRCKERSGVC